MKKGVKLYSDFQKMGIDPFKMFVGREFVKGQKHNFTTFEFKKEDVMTLDELKKKVNSLIAMQQNILSR